MQFSEKMVATRELRFGVETRPTSVRSETLIRPADEAVSINDITSDFDFNLDNIAEDPRDLGRLEETGSESNMISRSDLADIRNATDNNYHNGKDGSYPSPLDTRSVDIVQLKSERFVPIHSVDDCVVVEVESPLIEKPVILSASDIDSDADELAREIREERDVSIELTEEDSLEMSVKRENKIGETVSRFIVSMLALITLIMAGGLFVVPLFSPMGLLTFCTTLLNIIIIATELPIDTKYETETYESELLDDQVIFEGDVSQERNEERTVTFRVREEGEGDTRLIADEVDAEWVFDEELYDSDLVRFFESIGFEKVDRSQFTAVVHRSNSVGGDDHIESEDGEWAIPVEQGVSVTDGHVGLDNVEPDKIKSYS